MVSISLCVSLGATLASCDVYQFVSLSWLNRKTIASSRLWSAFERLNPHDVCAGEGAHVWRFKRVLWNYLISWAINVVDWRHLYMSVVTWIRGFRVYAVLRKWISIWLGFVEFPIHELHKDKCQTYVHDNFIVL